jgi:hypothetical protein
MSYHTSNDLNKILHTLDSMHNTSISSVVDSLLESHPSHPEAEKLVEHGPKLVGLIGAHPKSNKAALYAQASEESMRSDAEEMRELLSEATTNKTCTNTVNANLQFAEGWDINCDYGVIMHARAPGIWRRIHITWCASPRRRGRRRKSKKYPPSTFLSLS